MKRLNIYLAGACKGLVDEGTSWRNEAFERFILAQKYLDLIAYHLYDPTEYFPRDGSKSITAKQTKNFYIKYLIANSDLILVNLNNTENYNMQLIKGYLLLDLGNRMYMNGFLKIVM